MNRAPSPRPLPLRGGEGARSAGEGAVQGPDARFWNRGGLTVPSSSFSSSSSTGRPAFEDEQEDDPLQRPEFGQNHRVQFGAARTKASSRSEERRVGKEGRSR